MPHFAASHRLWHRLRSGRSAQPAASGRADREDDQRAGVRPAEDFRQNAARRARGGRGAVGDRLVSRGGGARAASVFVRQGESVAAPRGRERHVLADLGGKVAAG